MNLHAPLPGVPKPRPHSHDHDLAIPRGPLLAAAALVVVTILGVGAIRTSGVDVSTRSQAAVVVQRALQFEDQADGGVKVLEVLPGQAPVLLQTVAAQAGIGSALQLLSQAAQPVSRAPVGCHVSTGASAAVLSMQSMMRVAAMEFGMVQWASADVGRAAPQPLSRWVLASLGLCSLCM